MTRKSNSLAPIMNLKARRSTYKKRKETIMRKTREMSMLCGVDACIIMYKPDRDEPDVWPERGKTLQILSGFYGTPEAQRTKNMVNQNGIMSKKIEKVRAELRKVEEENCRLEAMVMLHDVAVGRCAVSDVVDFGTVSRLSALVETRLDEVRKRMHELLPVQKSVGPLEEVLLQARLPHWPTIDVPVLSYGQHNFGLIGTDVPLQEQRGFGFEVADVGSQVKDRYKDCLASIVMASPVQQRYTDSLSRVDTASPVSKGYTVDSVGSGTAQLVHNKCMFGLTSADMPPLQDKEICLPSWYPVVGSSEEEDGPESVDMADSRPLRHRPTVADEMSQLLNWSCSEFEEILASL